MNIPLGPYRQKLIALPILAFGVIALFVQHPSATAWLYKWLIALGATLYNFSLDRKEDQANENARLLSFKAAGIFIVCMQLAYYLVVNLMKLSPALSIMTNVVLFNVVYFVFYQYYKRSSMVQ